MARVGTIQPSFAAGEVSPRLYGRVDIGKYGSGAEAIENFLVRPEGGLMRRHGTRFAAETKTHAKRTRLIPFVFSTVQAYMLEFGDGYMRVHKDYAPITSSTKVITGITQANPAVVTATAHGFSNGDRVVVVGVAGMGAVNNREFEVANQTANTFELSGVNSTGYDAYTSGGTASKIFEIVSPYAEADLDGLFATQSTNTVYLAHPSYPPYTLVRGASHTDWTLAAFTLDKGPFAPRNSDEAVRIRVEHTDAAKNYRPGKSTTIKANANVFAAGHVGSLFYAEEMLFDQLDVSPWQPSSPRGAVGDQRSYGGNVYAVAQLGSANNTGLTPPTHTQGDAWDGPNIGGAGGEHQKWRYLHSRYGVFRITAVTDAKTATADIVSYCPHGFNQPALTVTGAINDGDGNIRLSTAPSSHQLADGDYVYVENVGGVPNATGYWRVEDVAATTIDLVGSTWGGTFTSGGTIRRFATWLWRFGAFSVERGYPACVGLHEQRLVFANTRLQPFGIWASAAGDYPNFLPGTNDADAIAYNIAGNQADPIRWVASASDLILGTLAQEYVAYGGGLGDPITPANTRIVPQSGEGSNGVKPVKVGVETLFVNRAGRKIFSYLNQADVAGYTATDLLELAEHLTLAATIERLAWAKNPASILWGQRSDGSLIALTYRREQQIFAWTRQPLTGTVESIAVIPSPDGTTDDLWLIVNRTINGQTRRYVEYLAPPFEPANATDKDLMGFVDSALRYTGAATSSVSGLYHLEGQTVKVVADGSLHPDRVVTGGKIALEAAASNVWAGLAYTSRVRSLRLDVPGAGGTAQGKTKRVARLTVRVHNAIGGTAGPGDESVMEELVRREQNDPMDESPPMRSGDYDAFLASDFDLEGRVAIVQSEPMPLDILAIMPLNSYSEG